MYKTRGGCALVILLALCGQAVSAQQIPGFEFDHFEFPGGEFFGEASCRVIGDADSSDINSFPKLFMTSCPPGFRAETFISSLGVPAELPGGTQEGFLVVLDAPVTLAANTSFTVAGLGRGSFESTTSLQNAQPPGMDPGCLNTITTPTTTGSTTVFPHEFECGINALSGVSEALPGPNQGLFFLGSSFIGTWTPATGAKLVIQYAIITFYRQTEGSDSVVTSSIDPQPPAPEQPLGRDDPLQFSATVDWRLASRPQADLTLCAFDQNGILVASSDFMNVQRDNSPDSATLMIPPFAIPPEATSITVKAVLIDVVLSTILAESDEFVYPLAGDTSTITTIDPMPPPPDMPLPREDPVQFMAQVDYELVTQQNALVSLLVIDQDSDLIAQSEFKPVDRDAGPPPPLTCMIDPFAIPDDATSLTVFAALIDGGGPIIVESNRFIYPLGGDELILSGNLPAPDPEGLERDRGPAIMAKLDYKLFWEDEGQLLLLVEDQDGGSVVTSKPETVTRGEGSRTLMVPEFDIPHEAGNLVLLGLLTRGDGLPLESNKIDYPLAPFDIIIDSIQIVQSFQTRDNTVPLVPGKSAVVRVFPKLRQELRRPFDLRVSGTLVVEDPAGGPLATLNPINRRIRPRENPTPTDRFSSLNFLLGLELTGGAAALSRLLEAEIKPPGKSMIKEQEGHPLRRTLQFERSTTSQAGPEPPWNVEYFPYCYRAPGTVDIVCPDFRTIGQQAGLSAKLFPLSDGRLRYRRLGIQPVFRQKVPENSRKVLRQVQKLYQAMENFKPEQLVGWFPNLTNVANASLPYCGVAFTLGVTGGSSGADGIGRAIVMQPGVCNNDQAVLAHELGHNLGLLHLPPSTGCGTTAWVEPGWPRNTSSTIGSPGFDVPGKAFVPASHMT